jgi:hypothetical protein
MKHWLTTFAAASLLAALVSSGWSADSPGKGPLAGLPSQPGPHIDKIKALEDNSWLELGTPGADPKWGRARGRSWTARMPLAPELRGAFLSAKLAVAVLWRRSTNLSAG